MKISPEPNKRSVSQLKTFTRCGEAYRLERQTSPPPPQRPAAWTILGDALHATFEEWERSDRQIDVVPHFTETYDSLIEQAMAEQPDLRYWQTPPGTKYVKSDIARYRKRGIEGDVPEYKARCLEAGWEILKLPDGTKALELEFSVNLGSVVVRGKIDRLQYWPKSGLITAEDLKTGSPDEENDARQLGLYRLGAKSRGVELQYGRYWFTKVNRGSEWIDLSRYTEDYLKETYETLDTAIDNRLWLARPGKHCGLCSVRPWCSELGWLKPGEPLYEEDTSE